MPIDGFFYKKIIRLEEKIEHLKGTLLIAADLLDQVGAHHYATQIRKAAEKEES